MIAGLDNDVVVNSFIVALTSPPDARYSPLTKAPVGPAPPSSFDQVRALVLAITPHTVITKVIRPSGKRQRIDHNEHHCNNHNNNGNFCRMSLIILVLIVAFMPIIRRVTVVIATTMSSAMTGDDTGNTNMDKACCNTNNSDGSTTDEQAHCELHFLSQHGPGPDTQNVPTIQQLMP